MAKYRIEIDRDACIGDSVCCDEAPNTFKMGDDDIATVADAAGDPDDKVLEAAKACPVDAIILYDAKTGEKIWPKA
jgi:ferredoxin